MQKSVRLLASDSEHQEIYQKGQSNREEKWEVLRENRKDLRVRMTSFKDTLFLKKYQAAAPPLCCFFIFNFLVLLLHAVFWVLRLFFWKMDRQESERVETETETRREVEVTTRCCPFKKKHSTQQYSPCSYISTVLSPFLLNYVEERCVVWSIFFFFLLLLTSLLQGKY